jgi:hypothetical protein
MVFILIFATLLPGAEVLDRIAVIAGTHAIKLSDIERDIRLTQFLNREPLKITSAARHDAAERLITQEIIRQEIVTGLYRRPPETDATALVAQIRRERFGNSIQAMAAALEKYGLTEPRLRERLLWQITVLQFINQRFRAGVVVTDDDVKTYYVQHAAELRKQDSKDVNLEAAASEIKSLLEGQRIDAAFNDWLDQTRKDYRVEYKQEALQ